MWHDVWQCYFTWQYPLRYIVKPAVFHPVINIPNDFQIPTAQIEISLCFCVVLHVAPIYLPCRQHYSDDFRAAFRLFNDHRGNIIGSKFRDCTRLQCVKYICVRHLISAKQRNIRNCVSPPAEHALCVVERLCLEQITPRFFVLPADETFGHKQVTVKRWQWWFFTYMSPLAWWEFSWLGSLSSAGSPTSASAKPYFTWSITVGYGSKTLGREMCRLFA